MKTARASPCGAKCQMKRLPAPVDRRSPARTAVPNAKQLNLNIVARFRSRARRHLGSFEESGKMGRALSLCRCVVKIAHAAS